MDILNIAKLQRMKSECDILVNEMAGIHRVEWKSLDRFWNCGIHRPHLHTTKVPEPSSFFPDYFQIKLDGDFIRINYNISSYHYEEEYISLVIPLTLIDTDPDLLEKHYIFFNDVLTHKVEMEEQLKKKQNEQDAELLEVRKAQYLKLKREFEGA
jgi:hypothetical protein